MKKLFYYIAPLALMLGATSCLKDDKGDSFNVVNTYSVLNIVTDMQDGSATASFGDYQFNTDLIAGTAVITASRLEIDKEARSFETMSLPIVAKQSSDGQGAINTITCKGVVPMHAGTDIADLDILLTDNIWYFNDIAPGVTGLLSFMPGLYARYVYGGRWMVKTMLPDTWYCGTTVTSYPSAEGMQSFENKDIRFRVVIKPTKNTADIVICDAKFAPQAPSLKGLILRDLPVTFAAGRYSISGSDIVPEQFEGAGAATPNTRFPFNTFELTTTTDNLTGISCEFTVAGSFKGSFKGSVLK